MLRLTVCICFCFSWTGCQREDIPAVPPESNIQEISLGYYLTIPDEPDSIKRDRVEIEIEHEIVFASIDIEVEEVLNNHPRKGDLGFCHIYWETKKEILFQKHGIAWRTPAELNPNVRFE